ncbi:MAG: exo-alpha-sialidase [Clostridia bacterium]|nr:exo-alpha-sialidase [Clostridia bacterium]
MDIKLIGSPKIVMTNTKSHHAYFAWPTIAKLQNGKICVGASGYRVEHICPFGKGVLAFSEDNGETYSEPVPVFDTVLDDRDVGLTVFGESGLIATSFNNTLEFQRENMPQTQECFDYINSVSPEDEAEALGISFRISKDCGETFGQIYKSPVSSPHGPTVLNDGTVLWVGRKLGIHNHMEAYVINTENGEMTFRGDLGLYNYDEFKDIYFYEPHAVQLPDGKIICHLRAENKEETLFTLYQTVSSDNGVSWSKPQQIIRDDSGAPAHLFIHSSGTLISTFSHRSKPYGIWAVFSEDNGETWSEESVIFEGKDTDDLGYPSTIELSDGSMITAFYTRENDFVPAVIMQQKWALIQKQKNPL